MLGAESLERSFEQHAHGRDAGNRSPLALLGVDAVAAWTRALAGRPIVRSFAITTDSAAIQYLADPTVRRILDDHLQVRVAAVGAVGRASANATESERELWAGVTGDALLRAGDQDGQLLIERSVGGDSTPQVRVLAAALRVLGGRAPALLLESLDTDAAARVAVALTEALPPLPIGISTTQQAWTRWLETPNREHAKAVLRAWAPHPSGPRCETETNDLRPIAVGDEEARSAAERRLYQALEADSRSRGLFVLNHELEVRFGTRRLEIDLAAPTLRLGVEVDGYFHFQDADAYRRDRRKDVALQREAWFVMRVLAEDVAFRLEETVAAINETITFLSEEKTR